MAIRKFKLGDEAALFRVFFTAVHQVASRDYSAEQVAAWAPADFDLSSWALHLRRTQPFVAVLDGQIVGYADLQADGEIDHFYVSGTHPRQGIGAQLMAHLHKQAGFAGLPELRSCVSKTAEPFFVRHGFECVERRFPERRGVVLENTLMRKKLRSDADA
ncbi:GNAT family N-acetyltransferase [Curvibacter sp. HBC28]|uniref:GNAT family N-acetyltransferase n=1 Tax=Curvibacter microcysteis TaxID=3026419 RepID=A0ABT5MBN5_9BURK|nr:GNAT family N-acetyltransferase [Curvibacter sp. HBC28]MDD0813983.1 GNAT family N-acetyltransferase [Curvibacter sp. HBC28]